MLQEIDSIIADVNKKYGDDTVVKGSRIHKELPRITTGVLSFDLMLGGGWPVNQWSEIIGNESSGKTALAYKTIAANQALDPEWTAMWVAAEEYVPAYAEAIGVDLDRLWVVETNVMEYVYDISLRVLDKRAVDCIVIDSLPALVPSVDGPWCPHHRKVPPQVRTCTAQVVGRDRAWVHWFDHQSVERQDRCHVRRSAHHSWW
jgi:recombination protein RecA